MKNQWILYFTIALLSTGGCLSHAMADDEDQEVQMTDEESRAAEAYTRSLINTPPDALKEDPGCRAAWTSSSAAKTCTTTDIIAQDPVGTCYIKAVCMKLALETRSLPDWKETATFGWRYEQNQRVDVFFRAPLGQTKDLINCDGKLNFNGC